MNTDFFTMRELVSRAFARYLRVLPSGFQLSSDDIVPSISANIIASRPARTLYKNRKPVCRSLDGVHALSTDKNCAACLSRKTCTPHDLSGDNPPGGPLAVNSGIYFGQKFPAL